MTKLKAIARNAVIALASVLAAVPLAGTARTVLDLDVTKQPVLLADWGDAWLDAAGSATAAEVGTSDSRLPWQQLDDRRAYTIPRRGALWIRFIVPPAPDSERWYLEVPSPLLDAVTLYTQDGVGAWNAQTAGASVPVSTWPVPSRYPLLPVMVSAEVPRRFLLKIETTAPFLEPLRFVSERYINAREQRTSLFLGAFLGLECLIALIMAARGFALRDKPYLLGASTVLLLAGWRAAVTGVAGLHLWNGSATLGRYAPDMLATASMWSLVLCSLGAVSVSERWPTVDKAARLAAPCAALGMLGFVIWRPSALAGLQMGFAGIVATLLLWSSLRSAAYVQHLLYGFLVLFATAVPEALHAAGLIPSSFTAGNALQFGTVVFSLVLLQVLSARIAYRRENRRRVLGLDRIDPMTGLVNRFEFTERLLRMVARSQRLRYTSALFVVDIVNCEQLARDYGRITADELPVRVARRLLSTVRDIDTVARIGQHRFGMLVEGPLSKADATSLGPRLVARCLMPFRNRPEGWVARTHVAQALLPLGSEPATMVLERLEDLLTAVPAGSRKAVFTLGPTEGEAGSRLGAADVV